jgi:hypothetical protein
MSRFYGDFDPASTATTVTGDIDTSFTSLYMPGDTSIADESGTQTLTTGGSPTISSLNQFGGGSIHFNSSADYIQFNNASNSLNFSSAFSIEFWAYPTGNSTDNILYFSDPSNNYHGIGIYARSSTWTYRTSTGGESFQTGDITFGPCTQNQWQHVSLCRTSDNVMRGFVNGVFGTAVTIAGTFRNDGSYGISRISPASQRYLGYIDDLVILKNHALRTTSANFDVPTQANGGGIDTRVDDTRSHSHVWNYSDVYDARFADTWPSTTIDSRISLYLPFEDDTLDKSSYNHTLTTSGPITLDTSQAKFGSKSARFAGSSHLTISDNSVFDLNGTDFTIEMFVYFPDSAGQQAVISKWTGSGTNKSFIVMLQTGAGSYFYWSNDGINNQQVQANDLISVGQWTHIAVTQTGSGAGSGRLFINGTVQNDTDDFSGIKNNSTNVIIGGRDGGGVSQFSGFIEDLRVIKGLSLYTTAFTVPTAPVGTSLIVNP